MEFNTFYQLPLTWNTGSTKMPILPESALYFVTGVPMNDTLKTISPVDGSVYVERSYASESGISHALEHARKVQAPRR